MTFVSGKREEHVLRIAVLLAMALVAGEPAFAHEGETHAEPAKAPVGNLENERRSFSGFGESFELTVIYGAAAPPLLRLILSTRETNEPVDDATLALTLSGGAAEQSLTALKGENPGEYSISTTLAQGVTYSLLVDATKGDVSDFFSIDNITLPEKTVSSEEHTQGDDRPWSVWLLWAGISAATGLAGFAFGRTTRQPRKIEG